MCKIQVLNQTKIKKISDFICGFKADLIFTNTGKFMEKLYHLFVDEKIICKIDSHKESRTTANAALLSHEETGDDFFGSIRTEYKYFVAALLFLKSADYDKAIKYFMKSKSIAVQTGNTKKNSVRSLLFTGG